MFNLRLFQGKGSVTILVRFGSDTRTEGSTQHKGTNAEDRGRRTMGLGGSRGCINSARIPRSSPGTGSDLNLEKHFLGLFGIADVI